ncbi:MAG: hypothetical protein MUP71_13375 [Candidatus Aminicenantes bacterium]|nr:hypothetical protein [Candidatus Aminicenantes bacterium]
MNCKKVLIFTAALAWLAVAALGQSITVTAPNGGERWMIGDPVTITWTAADIPGDVRILLLRSGGALVGTIASAVPISPGSFSWEAGALAPGSAEAGENYLIRIRSNRLDIWDNSNAAFALVGRQPNIKISTMKAIGHTHTIIPLVFAAGDSVTIMYYLQNDSSYAAGAFNVGLRLGGTIVARNPYPELANGASASGEFIWTATCGSPIAVVADCDGAVAENNEGDNVMTDPELACTLPNLMFFRDLYCSSGTATAKAGLPYAFRATMHSDLVRTHNVRVTGGVVGGAVLYDETFAELAPEALQDVSFVWEVPEGAQRVYFDFDPDNTVSESNERDNRQELAITGVVSTPATEHYDIRTTINKAKTFGLFRRGQIEVKQGQPLTVRGEVSGTTGAVRDIKITAWVQAGKTRTQLYEQDFSSIASLTVPFSFPWTPAVVGENTLVVKAELGPHAVGVGVVDSNPANNADSVRVTVFALRPRLR